MTTPEILLLILAIGLLVFSFVLVDKEKMSQVNHGVYEGGKPKPELSKEDIKELKEQINKLVAEELSNAVIDADDKMSKISNEKIMAVNEFSNQLLVKIEQNNSEVVFLYNTLTQKEEDIKVVFAKMETIRRENKEFLEKLATLMASKSKAKEPTEKKNVQANALVQKMNTDQGEVKSEEDQPSINKEGDAFLFINEDKDNTDHSESNRKEEILKLYKDNKTILEISKQLNLGQGEVKLVIDLFAKK